MEEFKPQVYFIQKYYDKTGKRVSIRATQLNRQKLILEIWRASKKDVFKKKFSREIFENLQEHHAGEIKEKYGVTIETQVLDITGEHPKKEFLTWCRENFYKKVTGYIRKTQLVPADFYFNQVKK